MHKFKVSEELKTKAKKQIKILRDTEFYSSGYKGVEAWKGLVAEFICSDELSKICNVQLPASGIDFDTPHEYDMIIDNVKVDIKCATSNANWNICPNVHLVDHNSAQLYIGCRYISSSDGDFVEVHGAITREEIMKCTKKSYYDPKKSFYEVPFHIMKPITKLKSNI